MLKKSFSLIEAEVCALFADTRSGIPAREDSRAFGAMIEKKITDNWKKNSKKLNFDAIEMSGRRTIFDFACCVNNVIWGFDVKTKDLDSEKYSDGGVCAISNLFKFLANDNGIFVIVEFGHKLSSVKNCRDIDYIKIAPFHVLPESAYRIENLGTGQVRLNYSLNQVWNEIEWNRSIVDFFNIFCKLAKNHYNRVRTDAEKRVKSIEAFVKNDYRNFKFSR
jgi:hypothetical protein